VDGFDRLRIAKDQFRLFQRADEVAALLSGLDETSDTEQLELSAAARFQLGELHTALEHLRIAAARADRAHETRGRLGMLLELLDRPRQALDAYRGADDHERSALIRYRFGTLLQADGLVEEAVTQYLRGVALGPILAGEEEVDPALPGLIAELNATASTERIAELANAEATGAVGSTRTGDAGELLEQVARRASSHDLLSSSSMRLSAELAASGAWELSWASIVRSQRDRLPSLPFTADDRSDLGSPLDLFYDECCETEPIQPRTVLYESSLGATTSCNPLAICRELLDDPQYADLLHVWSIAPGAAIHPSLLDRPNVVFVRKGSPGHFRYLASAGYIVNNSTIEYGFSKRDGQRYLNTWHGVPWKTMGRDNRSEPFAYGNISRNFLHADAVLGPDPHTLDVLSRGHDVDQLIPQVFVRGGYPRNDLSVKLNDEDRAKLRDALGVPTDGRLVLYMPTWKGTFTERDAEVQQVVDIARGLGAPGLTVAVRAHHYVSEAFRGASDPEGFVFVPPQLDTNELIGAADAVVTDFSSVLFDAAAVGVPVVKLIADIEEYSADRGLYFGAEEVPGANARSTEEARQLLLQAVQDRQGFIDEYAELTTRFSSPETGTSARRAVELLFGADGDPAPDGGTPGVSTESENDQRAVLLSTGGLPPNGITRSVRSLIAALDGSEYTPYLMPNRNALEGAAADTLADVRRYARVLPQVGQYSGTRMEREALQFFSTRRYIDFPLAKRHVARAMEREARRLFGQAVFHSAVEFSAYDAKNIALVNDGVRIAGGRRGIIFHNEMWKEIENKYPRLRAGLLTMDRMAFCASVSDGVRDYNAETMHEHLGVPREKHITIENTINVAEIRALAEIPLDPADAEWYGSEGAHACVIARLSHEKNHAQLFDALAACREKLSRPVKITCLGEGPLRLELERQIAARGLGDLVRLRGLVPNPQSHLEAAGALILPSLHEGQPLVILEALTVGAPVVATDTPGSRSVLHDGAFGPIVPISLEGLVEALHRVADGRLSGTETFDPEAFTARSLRMFTEAIDPVG
jgi:CDP-glycerol glycerophosphotransferase (TagB/SpsB family)/glycosyltransferase involved in cell wall biosynthesis